MSRPVTGVGRWALEGKPGKGVCGQVFLTICALWILSSCVAEPERSGTSEPSTITVLLSGSSDKPWLTGGGVEHLVFLPLFDFDEQGNFRGKLVRDWEASPDGRTWTYHLRSDVRWHDGVPVTSADIEFTHRLLTSEQLLWWPPGAQTLTVVDDTTFTVVFHRPGDPAPLDWWAVYYPKHILDTLDLDRVTEWEFWSRPVGNGPYRYSRHVEKTFFELEANPDYFRGEPAIKRVILRLGGTDAATELEAGNVDLVHNAITPTDAQRLIRQARRFATYYTTSSGTHLVYWNHRHPVFEDLRIRQALSSAIDRTELAAVMDMPAEIPLADVPLSYEELFRGEYPAPAPPDLEDARRILEEAGWTDEDGDGWRERNGTPLAFDVLVSSPSLRLAVALQESWKQVGARMEIETIAAPVVRQRLLLGEFDVAVAPARFDWLQVDAWSQTPDLQVFGFYENAELQTLLAALEATPVPAERERLLPAIWEEWTRDIPATVLVNDLHVTAAHRRIRGLSTPFRVFPYTFMEELRIEDEGTTAAANSDDS